MPPMYVCVCCQDGDLPCPDRIPIQHCNGLCSKTALPDTTRGPPVSPPVSPAGFRCIVRLLNRAQGCREHLRGTLLSNPPATPPTIRPGSRKLSSERRHAIHAYFRSGCQTVCDRRREGVWLADRRSRGRDRGTAGGIIYYLLGEERRSELLETSSAQCFCARSRCGIDYQCCGYCLWCANRCGQQRTRVIVVR